MSREIQRPEDPFVLDTANLRERDETSRRTQNATGDVHQGRPAGSARTERPIYRFGKNEVGATNVSTPRTMMLGNHESRVKNNMGFTASTYAEAIHFNATVDVDASLIYQACTFERTVTVQAGQKATFIACTWGPTPGANCIVNLGAAGNVNAIGCRFTAANINITELGSV